MTKENAHPLDFPQCGISTLKPEEKENETLEEARKRNKWENNDLICKGYILMVCAILFSILINFHESAKFYGIV